MYSSRMYYINYSEKNNGALSGKFSVNLSHFIPGYLFKRSSFICTRRKLKEYFSSTVISFCLICALGDFSNVYQEQNGLT